MKKNLILNFHIVENPAWFETIIIYLKSAYKIVPLSHFEKPENYSKNKGLCHITFDDGDITFYNVVFPILKKHNIPASIFISPRSVVKQFNFWFQELKGYDNAKMSEILAEELNLNIEEAKQMGYFSILKTLPLAQIHKMIALYQKETNTAPKPFRNINLEQLYDLQQSGLISIGAHTLHHPILKNETDEEMEREISVSISELSEILREKVRYFAYPNGTAGFDFGEREIDVLKKCGIQIALSTDPEFVSRKSDKMTFPRIGITKGSLRFVKLRLFLGPKWQLIKSLRQPLEKQNRKKLKSLKN